MGGEETAAKATWQGHRDDGDNGDSKDNDDDATNVGAGIQRRHPTKQVVCSVTVCCLHF